MQCQQAEGQAGQEPKKNGSQWSSGVKSLPTQVVTIQLPAEVVIMQQIFLHISLFHRCKEYISNGFSNEQSWAILLFTANLSYISIGWYISNQLVQ